MGDGLKTRDLIKGKRKMDAELRQYLDAKFAEMDGKFATKQDLERVETALLFHKWASPALRAIDLEM